MAFSEDTSAMPLHCETFNFGASHCFSSFNAGGGVVGVKKTSRTGFARHQKFNTGRT